MIGDQAGHIPVATADCRRGIILLLPRPGAAESTGRDQTVRMNIESATGTEIAITSRRGREEVEVLAWQAGMWIHTFRAMGLIQVDAMSGRGMIGREMTEGDGTNVMTVATPLTESAWTMMIARAMAGHGVAAGAPCEIATESVFGIENHLTGKFIAAETKN